MANTQTISGEGRLPGFFTPQNIQNLQEQITGEISLFHTSQKVVIPAENIEAMMIYIHEHWGKRAMTLREANASVVHQAVNMFKNHLKTQRVSDYYLENEYKLKTEKRRMDTYKMNPRARSVQFQTTF